MRGAKHVDQQYISEAVFTRQDTGVYTYNQVEVVTKDATKDLEIAGWRMVWKTLSLLEKSYDLVKAMHVDSESLLNDAYCVGRSTQRTLTKVCCWKIHGRRGVLE